MKKRIITLFSMIGLLMTFTMSNAQSPKPSPPASAEGSVDGIEIKIDYHQPSAKGRKIMDDLVPFGKVWRTGANDATTIEFSSDVKIEGKDLPQGKYALFTIPNENEWVIIINKTHKQWGAYSYKEADDVLRVTVKPTKTSAFVETFNISVVGDGVEMKWENTSVKFKVSK